MGTWQLSLANIDWLARDKIAAIVPSKLYITCLPGPEQSTFEASIPAYAREEGRDMQLAILSATPCALVFPQGTEIPMFEVVHPDTNDHWWIEKGPWVQRTGSKYHDAPSFHRPGSTVTVRIGHDICKIHLYTPSISNDEFSTVLDDIKSWCWRMVIDDKCYATTEQDSQVRTLKPEFLRLAEEFIHNTAELLDLPHCELREDIDFQRADRLRPNSNSLRFIAQRGERHIIPGRSTRRHYNTPENRFVLAMVQRVTRMLRWTGNSAHSNATRFERDALRYDDRANILSTITYEKIDPDIVAEALRRSQMMRDKVRELTERGYEQMEVTPKRGHTRTNCFECYYKGRGDLNSWGLIKANDEHALSSEMAKYGKLLILGHFSKCDQWGYQIDHIEFICPCRDYDKECASLESSQRTLAIKEWRKPLAANILAEHRQEANTLKERANALRVASRTSNEDYEKVNALLCKYVGAGRKASSLGISADHKFVPTMVFLQSPSYSGALSAYRQIIALAGIDDSIMDGLLALEEVGLREWPGVYERWCLVSLLRVLQDDYHFIFNKTDVSRSLLRYCTGQNPQSFSVAAQRQDLSLELTLQYQAHLPNGRIPDFLLRIRRGNMGHETSCVLDAKACAFRRRPPNADFLPTIYMDDCLRDLIETKDYSQNGDNLVFILHASTCCITHPTTIQSWAQASTYGGDCVYSWETEKPRHRTGAVMLRPHDLSHLKRLVLMLIQLELSIKNICASCGTGGSGVMVTEEVTAHGSVKYKCRCTKCGFLTVRTHCINCKTPLFKNQASWSYHDLHPTDPWNIKCWMCGTLL